MTRRKDDKVIAAIGLHGATRKTEGASSLRRPPSFVRTHAYRPFKPSELTHQPIPRLARRNRTPHSSTQASPPNHVEGLLHLVPRHVETLCDPFWREPFATELPNPAIPHVLCLKERLQIVEHDIDVGALPGSPGVAGSFHQQPDLMVRDRRGPPCGSCRRPSGFSIGLRDGARRLRQLLGLREPPEPGRLRVCTNALFHSLEWHRDS